MRIYNLFPTLAGPFNRWKPHLERAADLGFNWVFVNPIHLPGQSGSLYSVKDYFHINPALMDENSKANQFEQTKGMVEVAEDLGLRLMVDLVVNHCATDSPMLKDHPEWFLKKNGRFVNASCKDGAKTVVWKDLVQFDYENSQDAEGLYQTVKRVVEFLADIGFQAFRCDAAYQIPGKVWERLIHETQGKRPNLLFLAETLGCSPERTLKTSRSGFQAIFNSSKWWDFHSDWLMKQYDCTREHAHSISFPESHDTPRLAHELNGNINGLKQRYFFAAFFSAGVMMPVGFEYGFRNRLHVVHTRPEAWETTDLDLTEFIRAVNRAKADHPVFNEESLTRILFTQNPNILLMSKMDPMSGQEALILLNKDIHHQQGFHTDSLYHYIQSEGPLIDVSPEYPLDYLPTPFQYDLRPGQGIVLVTRT